MDEIYVDAREVIYNPWYSPPQEPAEGDAMYIKHVICEGARFHILLWNQQGKHCSEPKCIVNKR